MFITHGDISSHSLDENKSAVQAIPCNHQKPLAIVFASIKGYTTMDESSRYPTTPYQLIDVGFIKITNAQIFSSDIRKWHEKVPLDKTWVNFKIHFSKAPKSIKHSQRKQNLSTLGFHQQANAAYISEKFISCLAAQQAK